MQNWKDTILSEYANSPVLLAIIESFNDAVDPAANINAFYDNVWNILTAKSFGLDIWGRIVGVSRVLQVPAGEYFGYEEGGEVSAGGFGQAIFYSGVESTSNYALSDDAFRVLILVKALSNISDCSIYTYNKILMKLFPGRGNAYVSDTGSMHARLTFEFVLQPVEIAILKQSGAFAPPTGVKFEIMDFEASTFSFEEAGPAGGGFNNGIFFRGYE